MKEESICDKCGACIEACPGNVVSEDGLDTWQCSVYYKGAHKSNPFITDEFLKDHPEREAILNGEKRFDAESAREIYKEMNFLPNTQQGYSPCLCGRKCDIACYKHIVGELQEVQEMRERIIEIAKKNGADIVGFAPASRFDKDDPIFKIIAGEAKVTPETARKILDKIYFYPPAQHAYQCSICGRSCDMACYMHLEEKGVLTKKFKTPFRKREEWKFNIEDWK